MLSLTAALVLSFSAFSQTKTECTANVEALEAQIRMLAELLGDETIIAELALIQSEKEDDRLTLSENDPNPYEVEHEIVLNIPADASDVEVVFSNSLGQQIKAIDVSDRGETSIKVFMSQNLKDSYSYLVVVDGFPVKS